VKLYKLCLLEIQHQLEKQKMNLTQTGSDSEVDSDDYEDESQDSRAISERLEDMLFGGGIIDDDDCLFDQIELEENPFGQTDILEFAVPILKAQPLDSQVAACFTKNEQETAGSIGLM